MFRYMYVFTDKDNCRHLRLEIASAIPASNDDNYWQFGSQVWSIPSIELLTPECKGWQSLFRGFLPDFAVPFPWGHPPRELSPRENDPLQLRPVRHCIDSASRRAGNNTKKMFSRGRPRHKSHWGVLQPKSPGPDQAQITRCWVYPQCIGCLQK